MLLEPAAETHGALDRSFKVNIKRTCLQNFLAALSVIKHKAYMNSIVAFLFTVQQISVKLRGRKLTDLVILQLQQSLH